MYNKIEKQEIPIQLDSEKISKMNKGELEDYCKTINEAISDLYLKYDMLAKLANSDSDYIHHLHEKDKKKSKIIADLMS